MSQNKKGFLHPFIKYLIESKQLEIIIEEYPTDLEEITKINNSD